MKKITSLLLALFAGLFAAAQDLDNLSPEEYARLEEKIFFGADLNALENLALYNEYFSREKAAPLYSAMFYYIAANFYKPQLILKAQKKFDEFYAAEKTDLAYPLNKIAETDIEGFGECLAKDFLRQFKTGKEDKKFAKAKIKKSSFENNGRIIYNFPLPSVYGLNNAEKKYYPLLALRGNIEVLRFLELISASAWAENRNPEYPFNARIVFAHIDDILTRESGGSFADLKNIEKEIYFSQELPPTDFLETDDNIFSKFILFHRYLISGESQKAQKLKKFLEGKKVDSRLLKSYILSGGKLVEENPEK